MRTTVSLDDQLLTMAKREALARHRSLASLVEEALRQMLAGTATASKLRGHVELPESGEGGLQSGIDLDNSADLLLVMEKRRCQGQSGGRRLSGGSGHRVRLRVDHHGPGFCTVPRPAMATSVGLSDVWTPC